MCFTVALIRDRIRILPAHFGGEQLKALRFEVERRYIDRVIPDVGLVVALKEFLSVEDAKVLPGDGAYVAQCTFQVILFCPFVGEVLEGFVQSSHVDEGVRITLGFFQDIYVAPKLLPQPCELNTESDEDVWVWKYEDSSLFFENEEPVFFRVEAVAFDPDVKMTENGMSGPAMRIVASMNQEGLGCKKWWES